MPIITWLVCLFMLLFPVSSFAATYWNATEAMTPPDAPAGATTYYVDNSCQYNGTGTTDSCAAGAGQAGRFNSIANAIASDRTDANGGVRILIHAGTYHEQPSLPAWRDGSEDHRKVIAAFGDGEVIIDGGLSDNISGGWTASGNLYYTTLTAEPEAIIIDNDYASYRPAPSLVACDAEGEWFWDSGANRLYIYPLSAKGDPSDDLVYITNGDDYAYTGSIQSGNTNNLYYYLYGLTYQCAGSHGVYSTGAHSKFELCTFRYNGKCGLSIQPYNTNTGQYQSAIKCKIFANALHNWPAGNLNCHYGNWAMGLQATAPNTTYQGNYAYQNYGEGIGVYGADAAATILEEDNISVDNFSMNYYIDCTGGVTFRRNLSYSTGGQYTKYIDADRCNASEQVSVTRRLNPIGIGLADENGSCATAQTSDIDIYNNLVIDTRRGLDFYHQSSGSAWNDVKVYENTFRSPNINPSTYSDSFEIWENESVTNTSTEFFNNIVIGQYDSTSAGLLRITATNPTGMAYNNNIYYSPNATPFYYASANHSFNDWQGAGQDAASSLTDPLLDNASYTSTKRTEILALTGLDINDIYPTASSTAIGAGQELTGYATDFDSVVRPVTVTWDAGAFEYDAGTPDVTAPTVTSASVNGDTVTVNFDETVVTTGYDAADFNIDCSVAGTDISLTSPSGSGASRTFTAATPVAYGDTCNLDYVGSTDDIEDAAGNDLATFSNTAVTNNTAAVQTHNGCMTVGGYRFAVGGKMLLVQ